MIANTEPLLYFHQAPFPDFLPRFLESIHINPEQGNGKMCIVSNCTQSDRSPLWIGAPRSITDPKNRQDLIATLNNASFAIGSGYKNGAIEISPWQVRAKNTGPLIYDISLLSPHGRELRFGTNKNREAILSQGWKNNKGHFSYGFVFRSILGEPDSLESFTRIKIHLGAELLQSVRTFYGREHASLADVCTHIVNLVYASGLAVNRGSETKASPSASLQNNKVVDHVRHVSTFERRWEAFKMEMTQSNALLDIDAFASNFGANGMDISIDVFNSTDEGNIAPIQGVFARFCRHILLQMDVEPFPVIGSPFDRNTDLS